MAISRCFSARHNGGVPWGSRRGCGRDDGTPAASGPPSKPGVAAWGCSRGGLLGGALAPARGFKSFVGALCCERRGPASWARGITSAARVGAQQEGKEEAPAVDPCPLPPAMYNPSTAGHSPRHGRRGRAHAPLAAATTWPQPALQLPLLLPLTDSLPAAWSAVERHVLAAQQRVEALGGRRLRRCRRHLALPPPCLLLPQPVLHYVQQFGGGLQLGNIGHWAACRRRRKGQQC